MEDVAVSLWVNSVESESNRDDDNTDKNNGIYRDNKENNAIVQSNNYFRVGVLWSLFPYVVSDNYDDKNVKKCVETMLVRSHIPFTRFLNLRSLSLLCLLLSFLIFFFFAVIIILFIIIYKRAARCVNVTKNGGRGGKKIGRREKKERNFMKRNGGKGSGERGRFMGKGERR